jgi:F0F1-type ATP synthase assembly protein I
MRVPWRSEQTYVKELRAALLKNHLAIYHALMHEPHTSLEYELAEFLLAEAGLDIATLMSMAMVEGLDG